MSNQKGDSIQIARDYLDSLVIEGRIVGAVHPSVRTRLFGQETETPRATGVC